MYTEALEEHNMAYLDFTGYNIPSHTQGSLERYAAQGIAPGGFLTAVLTNNLFGAVSRADDYNLEALTEIVRFVYNRMPMSCHGSTEAMAEFMTYVRDRRAAQAAEEE
ncbi:MAG: hypothetical protein LC650_02735 [Actinobacteria bacterium]|nr:hypothetical protein [Actinomycetota bacterium]